MPFTNLFQLCILSLLCAYGSVQGEVLQEIEQNRFIALIESEKPHTSLVDVEHLLKSHGFSSTLSHIDFHIIGKTLQEPGETLPNNTYKYGTLYSGPVDEENILPYEGTDLLKNLNFKNITFKECSFHHVDLSGSKFHDCLFDHCTLHNTLFDRAEFQSTHFFNCDLEDASFDSSQMQRMNFLDCKLHYTQFSHAQLKEVIFNKENFTTNESIIGANFIDADFSHCLVENYDLTHCAFDRCIEQDEIIVKQSFGQKKCSFVGEVWVSKPSSTKLFESLKKEVIPIKFPVPTAGIDPNRFDAEVYNLLTIIESEKSLPTQSYAYEVIRRAELNPETYPEISKVLCQTKQMVAEVDALAFPGGKAIEPEFFGQKRIEGVYLCEPSYIKTVFEFSLLYEAQKLHMPVLAICRGCQLANVFYGGTLHPVPNQIDKVQHYQLTEPLPAPYHLPLDQPFKGYSFHNHAIDQLAEGFNVVISHEEIPKMAISIQNPILLVQFHPEFAHTSGNLNTELSEPAPFWQFLNRKFKP